MGKLMPHTAAKEAANALHQGLTSAEAQDDGGEEGADG